MQLVESLKRKDKKALSQIAAKHHIYYDPDFSKAWISKEIKNKLSDPTYLEQLIETKFKTKTISTLKRLISTEPINKSSLQLSTYQMLIELGLIYDQNNFCYLPNDIKEILTDLLAIKSTKPTEESNFIKTTKQESSTDIPAIRIKIKSTPSFFHYLLLFLDYITTTDNLKENRLKKFISKLNHSSISTPKLSNYLQQYLYQNQILEKSTFKLKDNIDDWLNTSYKEKILTGLDTFFPNQAQKLRNTIAVLSHYPLQQQIPLDFFIKEINYRKSNLKQLKLLELMKIFTIETDYVKLTPSCWKLFNPKTKYNLIKPEINNQQLIITEDTEIKSLWSFFKKNPSIEIDGDIKIDEGGKRMSKNLEEKYPTLKKLRLERLKGKYKDLSQSKWHQQLEQFKRTNNISGKEKLKIDLAYRNLNR